MRVLILHDRYHERAPGGEIHVVRRERAMLESHGVGTRLLEWPPSPAGASLMRKGFVQLRAGYSMRSRRRVRAENAAFSPDVVHVHNFWPRLTPSVHYECHRSGIPVVQSLHNYRILCAADILLRDGRPCDLCVGRPLRWDGVRHRCERNSLTRSVVKTAAFALHHALDTWNRTVDVFIAPSASMRDQFVRGGIQPDRIVVKPQCAPDRGPGPEERRYFLYVGRLSPEKGVKMLLDLWEGVENMELRIVGSGALEGRVRDTAARLPNVHYLGSLAEEETLQMMRGAIATLVPSLWSEPFPLVIAESYAAATPVIASDTGSRAETVSHGITGLVFRAGEAAEFERAVRWAAAHPAECRQMGRAARARYDALHSEDANFTQLMSIYARARAVRRASKLLAAGTEGDAAR